MSVLRDFWKNVVSATPANSSSDSASGNADTDAGADQSLIGPLTIPGINTDKAIIRDNDTFLVQWTSFNAGQGKSQAFTDLLIIRQGWSSSDPEVFHSEYNEDPLDAGTSRTTNSDAVGPLQAGDYSLVVTLAKDLPSQNRVAGQLINNITIEDSSSGGGSDSGGDGSGQGGDGSDQGGDGSGQGGDGSGQGGDGSDQGGDGSDQGGDGSN
jgi:hypothetical protein